MKLDNRQCIEPKYALPGEDYCGNTQIDNTGFEPFVVPSSRDTEGHLTICEGLIDILAAFFNVSSRLLRSPKRSGKSTDRVRQIGLYVAHVTLGLNMAMVARGFGRSKSTVVHACRVIEDLRDDPEFDHIMNRVERVVSIAFSADLGA